MRADLASDEGVEDDERQRACREQQELEGAEDQGEDGADEGVGGGAVAAVDGGVVGGGRLVPVQDGGGSCAHGGRDGAEDDDHL